MQLGMMLVMCIRVEGQGFHKGDRKDSIQA